MYGCNYHVGISNPSKGSYTIYEVVVFKQPAFDENIDGVIYVTRTG